ncbi:DUF4834 family protein [Saccharicrinis fermentans]|uniref:DUF4834 domain-containing protein n=1 Tax=Saccharicrinis fermentans DSM 9555 = JCM 21142 TaxID=869213 RepID=W7YA34_9BACT|nr:DUF4834 family protein [Saccharicrinis fermentans]GAF04423.1 hypothetical protein JCM21142_83127 [Saccharicrinis fermentans DSM 9555 = JCM 21142]
MGVLRAIIILVAFYYLFRFIGRIVLPFLLAKGMSKMSKQYQRQQNFRDQQKREEGKMTIRKNSKNKKIVDADLGEYTDFEEVK